MQSAPKDTPTTPPSPTVGPGRDTLLALAEAARWAPSPDNNQPWAFHPVEDGIEVRHVRDRAVRSDVDDLFSGLAIGAAVENLVLAAGARGLKATVEHRHGTERAADGTEPVAVIRLHAGGEADPLHRQIEHRVTNRRPYRREPLGAEAREALSSAIQDAPTHVDWLEDRQAIRRAAGCVRVADRIRFEQRAFHDEMHGMLRFGAAEAAQRGDGMELSTLEIPRAMGPVLRLLRPWERMRRANRVGASRLFAQMASKAVEASGALALISTSEPGGRGYLEAGRSLERLWLKATELGLAVQPLGALPLFLLKLEREPGAFEPEHAGRLAAARETFAGLFPLEAARPVMLLRLGRAAPPTARTPRYPLEEVCPAA